MTSEYRNAQARRVVTGIDENGFSTVIEDAFATQRVSAPAFTICDMWESPTLPVPMNTPTPAGEVLIHPAGLVLRICTFPPDSAYDKTTDYQQSLDALQGPETFRPESEHPGMHVTDTLDVVTVISGELHIVLETGETLLRQGDCVIVKGVVHTWSNKTDKPAVLCSLIQRSVPGS